MSSKAKPHASVGTVKTDIPGVLARAKIMYAAILLAISQFPSLPITMPAFLLLITGLDDAQDASKAKTKGLASARDTKRDTLWTEMMKLKIHVQGLADTLDAVAASALIESAGLLVAHAGKHVKAPIAATLIAATGVVHLIANATLLTGKTTKKTSFSWGWSSDGGKTWNTLPGTNYANTEIASLPAGSYLFRVSATVGKTPGEWFTTTTTLTIH